MKTITNLIFIALLFITASLSAQEHGPVLGGSLGTLHEKVSVVSSNFEGYKLHYHIGYALSLIHILRNTSNYWTGSISG